MTIKTKNQNNVWMVTIDGAIKSGMEFDLADQLEKCLHQSDTPKIAIDMKDVPFINSAALGIFLNIFKEIEKRNGRFGLCSISHDVDNLLEITKLSTILDIFKNIDDALDSFNDKSLLTFHF